MAAIWLTLTNQVGTFLWSYVSSTLTPDGVADASGPAGSHQGAQHYVCFDTGSDFVAYAQNRC
jgi:hypothetical protein